ncbi:FAD-binding oxidoreductase [Cupriavidus consociatus]|uniref:FAD-binding oxidoreductase n=1 Tax=Cupriavidus consociatus TaxID=2821357 RepID=UPI001AE74264|nr:MULTISPECIES: FAD-binding oxidoreductase [unclassified Cupriavidus]MBP0625323.1 FAD-binding oxidoreductase [Cupriavidus sp. LEh25]MDK2662059.1 FAD-binding oxidoreductase [Cupriavidus sp. LEh21]
MEDQSNLLTILRGIVGDTNVLTEGDLSAWEEDWRKRIRGKALAVVRPASTDQVARVVQACSTAGTALVPQGGNTGLVAGGIPDSSGTQVLLSLSRMQAIRELDAPNLTVTVEAGCILQVLQDAAANAGLLFPLSLAAEGTCTIGGNLATNAGGTQVIRYGNARDLCLGLEVVTASGEIWDGLSGLRKDNTGYDLRDLFVGSEGTLGIITAATLKLFAAPSAQLTAWVAVASLEDAISLLGQAHRQLGAGLTGFEVMGQAGLALVARHMPQLRVPFLEASTPHAVLMELSDSESEAHARSRFEALLESAFEDGYVCDAVIAESLSQAHQLWHVRESIPLAQAEEGINIKHDISLPISRIPTFVGETDALLMNRFPGVSVVNFGHLGDGNLHYNVQPPSDCDVTAFLRENEEYINTVVYDQVSKFNGSISAEHGIGELKREKLETHKSPVALGMMRAIKHALDPKALLNPNRLLSLLASQPG